MPLEKSSSFLIQKQTKFWLKHWNMFPFLIGELGFVNVSWKQICEGEAESGHDHDWGELQRLCLQGSLTMTQNSRPFSQDEPRTLLSSLLTAEQDLRHWHVSRDQWNCGMARGGHFWWSASSSTVPHDSAQPSSLALVLTDLVFLVEGGGFSCHFFS